MHADVERILFDEAEIASALERVAREISEAYGEREFTVVCVLKGSCVFAADLIRRIVAPIELTFIAAESYRDGTAGGTVELLYVPREREILGKDCLLVDDILDTGRTLAALKSELISRGAREVRTCVFLDKPSRRSVDGSPEFRCFEVDDVFVVGYGLDFAGRYRNLPYVGALRQEAHSGPAPERS